MQANLVINVIILMALIGAGLWAIMTRSLIRAAIALALTSSVLTMIMFRFNSWLAAVFELSVCAGLISVVFISTISLTEPLSPQEVLKHMRDRLQRFAFLPILILVVGFGLSLLKVSYTLPLPPAEAVQDARNVLWYGRELDLLGQVIILIAGVFGVIILFREMRRKT
jgi:NADH-quinone oxidoreductase subunit J